MTCVVGIVCDGHVWLGGDSAATTEDFAITVRRGPKVFRHSDMLIGSAGSPRVAQLLRVAFTPPEIGEYQNREQYMVVDFVNALKELLKDESPKDDDPVLAGSSILVGLKGHLFCIYGDYQVEESRLDYNAIGCSSDIAIGALYASKGFGPPEERIKIALEAAQEHNATVRGPFDIISI